MKPRVRCWPPQLFPLRYWTQVAPTTVQATLRQVFAQWGLPERLRVDNGAPWGSWNDLPPALALWWIGLGIASIWNHPRHPQENGYVERVNGLVDQWGEPAQCGSFALWTERIAWLVQTQREEYPAVDGQSRSTAYPSLYTNPRQYVPQDEPSQWDLRRVQSYLAQGRWPRQVSAVGQITLYNRRYQVGRPHARSQVWVHYDAAAQAWVIEDERGQELVRHVAREITTERICRLDVSYGKSTAKTVPPPAP